MLAGLAGSSLAAVLLWAVILLLLIRWLSKGSLVSWWILLVLDLLAMLVPFFLIAEGAVVTTGVVGGILLNLLQVGALVLIFPGQRSSQ